MAETSNHQSIQPKISNPHILVGSPARYPRLPLITHVLATFDLVQNISSQPLNTHLFYNLDSWSRLSNTIAPTILANLVNTCLRNIGTPGSGTGASSIATALPTSLPSQTRLPSSTTLPTNLPASSSRLTTVPSSFTNSGTSGLTSILLTIFPSTTSGAVQATGY